MSRDVNQGRRFSLWLDALRIVGRTGRADGAGVACVDYGPLLGAFGLITDFSIEDKGHAVYYYSTERYRSFLKYVSGLYKKGYIDKEILTNTTAQLLEKSAKSYGGYFALSANWLGSWAMDRPPLMVLRNER